MAEKSLKIKIQEKLDKRIEQILKKKTLSEEDYQILRKRLEELNYEEMMNTCIKSFNNGFSSKKLEEMEK